MSSGPTGSDDARFVSLSDEDAVKEILRTTVLNLWRAVNTLTRLRPSKHERYRVAIFGSARAEPGTFVYDEVKRAAAAFAGMGCDIVTGGGPGLMQAANEGARAAGASGSVGIRVELPFEQDVNPFVVQAFEHETFFTRLHHFVIASDAFVVVPGGIGTVLETADDLAAAAGPARRQCAVDPRRQDVGGPGRVGADEHARSAAGARQPAGPGHPALRRDGRRRHRRRARTAPRLAGEAMSAARRSAGSLARSPVHQRQPSTFRAKLQRRG